MGELVRVFENSVLNCSLIAINRSDDIFVPIIDAAIAIGHAHPYRAVRLNIPESDIVYYKNIGVDINVHPLEIQPNKKFVTEKTLYKFICRSRTPKAELFLDWVTGVIKDIRRTGAYEVQQQQVPALPEIPIEKLRAIPDQEIIELNNVNKKIFRYESLAKSELAKDPERVLRGKRGGLALQSNIRDIKKQYKFLKGKVKYLEEIRCDRLLQKQKELEEENEDLHTAIARLKRRSKDVQDELDLEIARLKGKNKDVQDELDLVVELYKLNF